MTADPVPPERRAPLEARLPASTERATIIAAHERAIELDQDGYVDPRTGWFVFTAQALWERGACCSSGCRHCPFDEGARVEPRSASAGQPLPGAE